MSNESGLILYGYWRSSASYRVRIALNLKGLDCGHRAVHLVKNGGEQHSVAYHALNPQESVPVLVDGARVIRQSLAIIEYLEETREGHRLLPEDPGDRAAVRALALLVACDIHPLNNLRVMQYLERECTFGPAARERWTRHWMEQGFRAFEAILVATAASGPYCHGDAPGLADVCLIPQIYNAYRFGVDMAPFPNLRRINEQCLTLPAFDRARPENQPDAV